MKSSTGITIVTGGLPSKAELGDDRDSRGESFPAGIVRPIAFEMPDRLTDVPSWRGHIPFAFWIIEALQPRVFVELGTHKGDSYCAFCQAVDRLGLDTACYAVDTWRGDQQAGFYGEEVFAELGQYHEPRYGRFSRLIRSTFDDAAGHFADGSIDLIHIDGLHTYEAVRHDFETWRPKLSTRAVALFHDINVRESNFGVWRLWNELARDYPSFAFRHSHGLGVLAIGTEVAGPFKRLTNYAEAEAEQVRVFFSRLGGAPALYAAAETRWEAAERFNETNAILLKQELHYLWNSGSWRLLRPVRNLVRTRRGQPKETEPIVQSAPEAARTVIAIRKSLSWELTAPLRVAHRMLAWHRRSLTVRPVRSNPALLVAGSTPYSPSAIRPSFAQSHSQGHGDPESTRQSTGDLLVKRALLKSANLYLERFLCSGETLRLPQVSAPRVSIVLVLFNQAPLTLSCLRSVRETVATSTEVIIVDNNSTDETRELLSKVEGAKVILNDTNLHFIRACNEAAKIARGKYLLLLNNDVQLLPGALDAAVRVLDNDSTVGAVGARIIHPDGSLQEAGCIIWNDGACFGYGRNDNPLRSEYAFRRDVDFVSGAFLLTPTRLFAELGGLDENLAPAYYEDADYCCRLRGCGYRVVYEPAAMVVHYEFGSSSSESPAGLQTKAQKKFTVKHAATLSRQLPPFADRTLAARHADRSRGRMLCIDDRVPHRWLGSGLPRANEILRGLVALNLNVTLFPTEMPPESWHDVYIDIPPEVEVITEAGRDGLLEFLRSRSGFYDAILVSRPHNAMLLAAVRNQAPDLFRNLRIIYDAEAIFSVRDVAKARLLGRRVGPSEVQRAIANELAIGELADVIVTVSSREQRYFEDAGYKRTQVLGHAIAPIPTATHFDERKDLLFVGPVHDDSTPNADAVLWFARAVLPRIRAAMPERPPRFVIGGVNSSPSVARLAGDGIEIIGRVDSLTRYYDRARIFVVPTRFAAGIPLKAYEAAAHGVPMVTTKLIGEQLGWEEENEILCASADSPAEFAQQCMRLYTDPRLWERLRAAALKRVEVECSPTAFQLSLARILESALGRELVARDIVGNRQPESPSRADPVRL